MVEGEVQKSDCFQLDRSPLGNTPRLTAHTPNGQPPLTLDAIQDLVTTAQNTIIANTHETIAAAKADIEIYIKRELAALAARISGAEKCLERIPLQLGNARMPFNSPLRYPLGVQIVPGMPIYKRDIFNLLESDCITTAQVLELQSLPELTLDQRRTQIGEFLGVL